MNMKAVRIITLMIASILYLTSCSKSDEVSTINEQLCANPWQLQALSGGLAGEKKVGIDQIGYKEEIHFESGYNYHKYRDGHLIHSNTYQIKENSDPDNSTIRYIITFQGDPFTYQLRLIDDILYLDAVDCDDCFSYVYVIKM